MKCYVHPDREAIAICKSCGKGLCADCNVDIEKISYCKSCIASGKIRLISYPQQQAVSMQQENQRQLKQPYASTEVKRPTWLTIIGIFWFLWSIVNCITALGIMSGDAQAINLDSISQSAFIENLIIIDLFIGITVFIFGVVMFATAYGFLAGRKWSYKTGITIPIVFIITSTSQYFLYQIAGIPGPSLAFPIANFVTAFILLWYLHQDHVQAWLFKDAKFIESKHKFTLKCNNCKNEILQENASICPFCGSKNIITEIS